MQALDLVERKQALRWYPKPCCNQVEVVNSKIYPPRGGKHMTLVCVHILSSIRI